MEKANKLAKDLNIEFTATNDQQDRFTDRNKIVFKTKIVRNDSKLDNQNTTFLLRKYPTSHFYNCVVLQVFAKQNIGV